MTNDSETVDKLPNFCSDGVLMLVCCERDMEVREFRAVIEECLRTQDSGS